MTKPAWGRRKRGKTVATVKQGSSAVPIYRSTCRVRVRFTVAFYRTSRELVTEGGAREWFGIHSAESVGSGNGAS